MNKNNHFIGNLLLKLYKLIVKRDACILYRRPFNYTINDEKLNNGICPFCEIDEKIIEKHELFVIINNKYPYPNTQDHLLICPVRHIKDWDELTDEEMIFLKKIISKYLKKDYTLLGREFINNKDASVHHLHIHLIKQI